MAQRKNPVNSIKGKKDFARNRALTSSGNTARELQTQPLQFRQQILQPLSSQETPLSSLGHTNVETKFHFSVASRNTVGQKSRGGGSGSARNSHYRNSGKPDSCDGVVQCKVEESLGVHLPTYGSKCKGGELTTHIMRDKAIGMLDKEKNVGDNVDFHQHHEQQKHYEATPSFSTNSEVQSVLYHIENEYGGIEALSDFDARERPDDGDCKANEMEFEGGSEGPTFH